MKHIVRFIELVHRSRTIEANRVIRRYSYLIEEAHAHDRRREAETEIARKNVERVIERGAFVGSQN